MDEAPASPAATHLYGGQAVIEGVMMRGRTTVAMSVRPPSGEVVTLSEPLPGALQRGRWLKVPFVRGFFVLYETLVLGTRMLMRSAALAAEGEELVCTGCGLAYPVRDDIPVLLVDEARRPA